MRVVIDTNVLVSGIINPHGSPGRIIDLILTRNLIVLYDDRIMSEYREVLLRPLFAFEPSEVDALLDFIDFAGEQVTAGPVDVILADATDMPFLEVAIAGAADALITGNLKHFKPVRGHQPISIVSPAELLRMRDSA